MSTESIRIQDNLNQLSAIIDSLPEHGEEGIISLREMEQWLKNQFEHILTKRINSDSSAFLSHKDEKERSDGIIIFDKELKVLHFSAPRNYFYGPGFSSSLSLNMSDFLFHEDLTILAELLKASQNNPTVSEKELTFKTGPGSWMKGFLTLKNFDTASENPIYTALLRFPSNPEQVLTSYQSTILDNLPGMDVYLFDRDYRFIISGGREKERNGLTNDYYIGKTFFEVHDKKAQRSLFPFYNKALNGIHTEGEVRFMDQIYYIVAKPVLENDTEPIAGLLIAQNVTSDKLLEQQLRKRKLEAQRADQAKSIFIANLSHEIRTPLNAIIGFIEQLSKTQLNEDQNHLLSIVEKASNHLLYLVNEVVFLFKLGMGKVYIEKVPFIVNEMLEEIFQLMQPKAAEKNLVFTLQREKCPVSVIGDPYRLKQILMNLLANAIKFTDSGEVQLKCTNKQTKKNTIELTFTVTDTGPGIAKNDIPNIFDVFEQGSVLTQSSKAGAGLGLGICKRLTNLLDGEIKVKSQVKKGSEFIVKLPFEMLAEDVIIPRAEKFAIEEQLLAGKSILLADDDEHNLMLGEMILKNWGVKYTLVSNGCEALKAATISTFDVLLFDIQMPCMNGVDLITTLRNSEGHINRNTPAVSLSANILKSDISRYLQAGYNDYLSKPFKEEELYNKLCTVLNKGKSEPQQETNVAKPKVQKPSKAQPHEKIDLRELHRTARGDAKFTISMIQNFITQADILLDAFREAAISKNWNKAGEKAHKALPAFRYFGLNDIVESLRIIENSTLRLYQPDIAASEALKTENKIAYSIVQAEKLMQELG